MKNVIRFSAFLIIGLLVVACSDSSEYSLATSNEPARVVLFEPDVLRSSSFDMGSMPVGSSQTLSVRLKNMSSTTSASNIQTSQLPSSYVTYAGGSYPGSGGDCTNTLQPLEECYLVFEVRPLIEGQFSVTVELTYEGCPTTNCLISFVVAGTALPLDPAEVIFTSEEILNFIDTTVGTTQVAELELRNIGKQSAMSIQPRSLSSAFEFVGGEYPGTGGNCSSTLEPDQSCSVRIEFSPASATQYNETLVFDYVDSEGAKEISKTMSARGLSPAFLTLLGGFNLDYQLLLSGNTQGKFVYIYNSGETPATNLNLTQLSSPFEYTGGAYPGSGGTCSDTLNARQFCVIQIQFTPTGTQTYMSAPELNYFNGVNSGTVNFTIQGQGFANTQNVTLASNLTSPGSDATPTISVNNVTSNLKVHLFADNGCSTPIISKVASATEVNFVPTLSDGIYQFHVKVEDDFSNLTDCLPSTIAYELDTIKPDPTLWKWSLASSNDSTISQDVTPQIYLYNASGEHGTKIQIFESANCVDPITSQWPVADESVNMTDITYSADGGNDGQHRYYVQAIDRAGNVSACADTGLEYTLDTMAPETPSNLSITSVWHDSFSSSPLISWSTPSDPEPGSGLSKISLGLSTSASGGNDMSGNSWQVVDASTTSYSFPELGLSECVAYYPTVRSQDSAGNRSIYGVAPSFKVDKTNPSTPSFTIANDFDSTKSPTITLQSDSLDSCSFETYELSIAIDNNWNGILDGDEVGNVVAWKPIAFSDSAPAGQFQETGLDLAHGRPFFLSLRGKDSAGNYSEIATSAPWTTPPISVLTSWTSELTHPAPQGHDRMLVFFGSSESDSGQPNMTSVEYGGQPMTFAGTVSTSTTLPYSSMQVWTCNEACIQAASDSVISPNWENASEGLYSSVILQNVNQALPIFDYQSNAGENSEDGSLFINFGYYIFGVTLVCAQHSEPLGTVNMTPSWLSNSPQSDSNHSFWCALQDSNAIDGHALTASHSSVGQMALLGIDFQ